MPFYQSDAFHQPPSRSHWTATDWTGSTLGVVPTGSVVRSLHRGTSRDAFGTERTGVFELAACLGVGAIDMRPGSADNIFTPSA